MGPSHDMGFARPAFGGSLARYGAVTGSTGAVRLDQRAEAPGLYKTGNLKLTDNDNLVLAAA